MHHLGIYMIAAGISSLVTFYLQTFGLSSVVASCVVGLIGALVGSQLDIPHISAVIFTGTFVGMTDLDLSTVPKISIAGVISGLIFGISTNVFAGYGGRLGSIAFISLLFVVVAADKIKHVARLRRLSV